MNPLERSHCMNLFFLSRSSCQIGIAGGSPAYTTISISSRPVSGPARKLRSFIQSRPRPAVRTELPTLDSSTSTRTLERADVFELFFCILLTSISWLRSSLARGSFNEAGQLLSSNLVSENRLSRPKDQLIYRE